MNRPSKKTRPSGPIERYQGILKRRDVNLVLATQRPSVMSPGGEPQMVPQAPARKRIPPAWMQTVLIPADPFNGDTDFKSKASRAN